MDDITSLFALMLPVYGVRLAMVENLTLENTKTLLTGFVSYYIVSEEISKTGKVHQHWVICEAGLTHEKITDMIKEWFPDAKGNKCLAVRIARNPKQLIKYTLKDNNFIFKGFSKKFIDTSLKLSYSTSKMKDEFSRLNDRVKLKEITYDEYCTKYMEYKVKHEQPIYENHIIANYRRVAIALGEVDGNQYARMLADKAVRLPN